MQVQETTFFLDFISQGSEGYVALAEGIGGDYIDGKYGFSEWKENSFKLPEERDLCLAHIDSRGDSKVDFYIAPYLRKDRKRSKGNAVRLPLIHTDRDAEQPVLKLISDYLGLLVINSGTRGHQHIYMKLPENATPGEHLDLCLKLNGALGECDKAKHCDNDLLRLPGTFNWKHPMPCRVERAFEYREQHLSIQEIKMRLSKIERITKALNASDVRDDRSKAAYSVTAACRDAGFDRGQTREIMETNPILEEYLAEKDDHNRDDISEIWAKLENNEVSPTDDILEYKILAEMERQKIRDIATKRYKEEKAKELFNAGNNDPLNLEKIVQNYYEVSDNDLWIAEPFIKKGSNVSIVAYSGDRKSLLTLEMAVQAAQGLSVFGNPARDPISVLYIDMENDPDEIAERLIDFRCDLRNLNNLHYLSFPALPPIDTETGGEKLIELAEKYNAKWIILDTISRFLSPGAVINLQDIWHDVYNCTIRPLRARGISVTRLDHLNKQGLPTGSKQKQSDVDVEWKIKKINSSGIIECTSEGKVRSRDVPETVLLREYREPLRHEITTDTQASLIAAQDRLDSLADEFDSLDIPLDISRREGVRLVKARRGDGAPGVRSQDFSKVQEIRKSRFRDQELKDHLLKTGPLSNGDGSAGVVVPTSPLKGRGGWEPPTQLGTHPSRELGGLVPENGSQASDQGGNHLGTTGTTTPVVSTGINQSGSQPPEPLGTMGTTSGTSEDDSWTDFE